MLEFIKNEYTRYKEDIESFDNLYDNKKFEKLLSSLENIKQKNQTIILN